MNFDWSATGRGIEQFFAVRVQFFSQLAAPAEFINFKTKVERMKKRQRISNWDSAGFAVGRFRPAFLRLIVKIIFIYCLITMPFISEAAELTCGNGVVDPGKF